MIYLSLDVKGNENYDTTGNNTNCGLVYDDGDKIFYSNLNEDGELYVRVNGEKTGEKTGVPLCEDKFVKNINIYDGWVYYIACDDDFGRYKIGQVVRIKKDGSERENVPLKLMEISITGGYIYGIEEGTITRMKIDNWKDKKDILKGSEVIADSNLVLYEDYIFLKGTGPKGSEKRIFRIDKTPKLGDGVKVRDLGHTLDKGDKFNVYEGIIYMLKDSMLYSMNLDGEDVKKPLGDRVVKDINEHEGVLHFMELDDEEDSWGRIKRFRIVDETIIDEDTIYMYTRENKFGMNISGERVLSGVYFKDYFGSKDGKGKIVKGMYEGIFYRGAMSVIDENDYRMRVKNYEELIDAIRNGRDVSIKDKKIKRSYIVAKFLVKMLIRDSMDEKEKEERIHDYILRRGRYDVEGYEKDQIHEDSRTPYGLLIKGHGICTAYASTTDLMMNLAGIKSYTIKGRSRNEGHVWNRVRIDGTWYHIDLTWNDYIKERGGDDRRYFNLTEEEIRKDHEF